MVALMLPLLTEANAEEKTTLHRPTPARVNNEDHRLLQAIWIHTSRHIIINTNSEETGKS